MKRSKLFYLLGALVVLAMLSISCTKEGAAGANGADGADGVDGVDGVDGADGEDGTATCAVCHGDDATMVAKQYQWEGSGHNAATAIARSSNASCSPCHCDQGFHLSDGNSLGAGVAVDDPVTPNCYTCHNVHQTYTEEDMALTYPEVPEWHVTYGKPVDVDYEEGNMCAHCHQSRVREPVVDMDNLDAMYSGISSHYGPHYSSQANLLGGFGAYELVGSVDYGDGMHAHTGVEDACVHCHMGFQTANGTGGHNFAIDASSDLELSCAPCHNDGATAEEAYVEYYHDVFATINHDDDPPTVNTTSNYSLLGDLLVTKGVYTKVVDSVGGVPVAVHYNINSDLEINGTLTAAMFNHRYLYQDHSHGVHNPRYAEALLTNSYEAVQAD